MACSNSNVKLCQFFLPQNFDEKFYTIQLFCRITIGDTKLHCAEIEKNVKWLDLPLPKCLILTGLKTRWVKFSKQVYLTWRRFWFLFFWKQIKQFDNNIKQVKFCIIQSYAFDQLIFENLIYIQFSNNFNASASNH